MKTLLISISAVFSIATVVPCSVSANEDDIIWRKVEHAEVIDHVIITPDGSIIASQGADRRVILWDAENGSVLRELENEMNTRFAQIKFSPDGVYIAATAADSTVKLWETATGKFLKVFDGLWGSARAFAFSPDGATIAIESSRIGLGQLLLFDIASGEVIREFGEGMNRESGTGALVFSPDGNTLYQGGGSTVFLWDVLEGKRKAISLSAGDVNVHYITISDNGNILAAGSRGRSDIYVYKKNINNWELITSFGYETESLDDIDVSPEGAFVVAASDHLRIWNVATKENTYVYGLQQPFFRYTSVAVLPDSSSLAVAVGSPAGAEVMRLRAQWLATSVPPEGSGEETPHEVGTIFPHPIVTTQTATLPITVYVPGQFTLRLYSLAGEFIAELFNATLETGHHDLPVDIRPYNIAAGSYYMRVTNGVHTSELSVIVA